MKAVIANGYGSSAVLALQDVSTPLPQADEVRIKLHASPVSQADTMMRQGTPRFARLFLGLLRPKHPIPGTGLAGVVDCIGDKVTHLNVGDEIYGESADSFGCHAQYIILPSDALIRKKPKSIAFEQASTLCDGPLTAYNFLVHMANIQPQQTVLINGASGSIGHAAVQIAKAKGANVIAVCSQKNHEWVTKLGADQVIDYHQEDFTQNKSAYDVIFDTVGKRSFKCCKHALTSTGMYLSPVLSLSLLGHMLLSVIWGNKKAKFSATGLTDKGLLNEWLIQLEALIEKKQLSPFVEKIYPLDAIHQAHDHVDTQHKKGSVVINLAS
ncbi:NAD(P)-dependent alcohol dehydrogenase [Oceaniserpentilla sp. 4NH20-0058]|uniref:NAD(P)-dependent alcohol dehydrogenase n=1 Tax=Oceaniserpentilla sp. 4NH20-0058 TaxID=3127660 RepID=UPI003109059A